MGYTIRRAAPADRDHVVALLAELFPGADVGARHDWIHRDNPHGSSLVWLAVDDSGEIAGCATYFPRAIVVQGSRVRAALGGDCWVRPAFRRRGIAAALHARGRREMPGEGIEVMFGTPTKANVTPLNQTGATNIGMAGRYARPMRLARVPLSRLVLQRGWGGARLEPLRGADPRVDEVWDRVQDELGIATVRDGAFYAWRFARAPARVQVPFVIVDNGRPVGACALERTDRTLRVIDLIAPRDRWGVALGAVVRHARAHHPGCDVLSLRLLEEELPVRQIWRWGCILRDRTVFNVLLPEGEARAEVYGDPSRWFVTWADTDVDRT